MRPGLDAAGIPHGRVQGFATPRRLAVLVQKLAPSISRTSKSSGAGRRSIDPSMRTGVPTQAAIAFARNCGVPVAELERLETDKGAWLIFRGTERGAATASLLGGIVNQAIAELPIAKTHALGAAAARSS